MTIAPVEIKLTDRYEKRTGQAHLTGIQALARLPIDQRRRDQRDGMRTGTYISGYEGSPLAGYDLELIRQTSLLDEHDITFEPGLNEEAAAMAVQGSQLIGHLPKAVDGVVGFWYAKAPGLDRATDALRHANLMGTSPTGGVGAGWQCQRSTRPMQARSSIWVGTPSRSHEHVACGRRSRSSRRLLMVRRRSNSSMPKTAR